MCLPQNKIQLQAAAPLTRHQAQLRVNLSAGLSTSRLDIVDKHCPLLTGSFPRPG